MNLIGQNSRAHVRVHLPLKGLELKYNQLSQFFSHLYTPSIENSETKIERYQTYKLKPGEECTICLEEKGLDKNNVKNLDERITKVLHYIQHLKHKSLRLKNQNNHKEALHREIEKRSSHLEELKQKREQVIASNPENIFVTHSGKHPAHISCLLEWLEKKDTEELFKRRNCLHREDPSSYSLKGRCLVCKSKVDVQELLELYNKQRIPCKEKKHFSFKAEKLSSEELSSQKTQAISNEILVACIAIVLGLVPPRNSTSSQGIMYSSLTLEMFFIAIVKIGILAAKELWGKLSEKESKKLEHLFIGVLTGVFLSSFESPELPLSEAEKTTFKVIFFSLALISSIGYEYITAEEEGRLQEITVQSTKRTMIEITRITLATTVISSFMINSSLVR